MKEVRLTQNGKRADIYIAGDIVDEKWKEGDATENALLEQLQGLGTPELHVHIDSLGGDVKTAWGMYNALRAYKGQVITHADGFVASAAIYPFMAGDKRVAADLSGFFFHQMATRVEGNAEEMRKEAEALEKIGAIGQMAIAERSGMDPTEVYNLMQNETWLTPQEAVSCGIATEVEETKPQTYTQAIQKQAIIGLADYLKKCLAAFAEKRGSESGQPQPEERQKTPTETTEHQPIMQKLFAKKE